MELQRVGEAVCEVVRHRKARLKRHIIWAGLWCGLGLLLLIPLLGIVEANRSKAIQVPLLLFPQRGFCEGINFAVVMSVDRRYCSLAIIPAQGVITPSALSRSPKRSSSTSAVLLAWSITFDGS